MTTLKAILKTDNHVQLNQTNERVPIIEPITESVTFESTNDFNNYYNEHKEEMEALSTCKLNKKYKIIEDNKPYKITKIKGVLSLRTIPQSRVSIVDKHNDLENRFNDLNDKVNELIQKINDIINYINNN